MDEKELQTIYFQKDNALNKNIMEIAIAIFLGLWLSGASFLAYRRLKREYKVVFDKQEEKEVEQ